ncbi:MAG: hypothetical protein IKF51_06590 [Solobacterium sp.]|nr:hypothetical protein [Solobacterium sp.]
MKNIRFYSAEKYQRLDYEEIEPGIYRVKETPAGHVLALQSVSDGGVLKELFDASGWRTGTGMAADFSVRKLDGKQYYKDAEGILYEDKVDYVYVTSLTFEQEPEFGEFEPSNKHISQYPLEDILNEYRCFCTDFYEAENEGDPVNAYVEFASQDIDDVRRVLALAGKHVFNQEDNGIMRLCIE